MRKIPVPSPTYELPVASLVFHVDIEQVVRDGRQLIEDMHQIERDVAEVVERHLPIEVGPSGDPEGPRGIRC